MDAAKTGALLSCASSIGAVLAGRRRRHGVRAGRVRDPGRARVPGSRRPARHLGTAGADRQAGLERPAPAQEVAPGRRRARRAVRRGRPPARAAGPAGPCPRPEIAEAAELVEPAAGGATRPRRPSGGSRWRCASSSARPSTPARARSSRGSPASSSRGSFDRPPRPLHPCRRRSTAAVDHLLSLQSPEGWWKGELETNVTMDAEDLLLRAVPRHPHRGADARVGRAGSAPSSATTAPGRNFYGGPGRPVDHGRGLRRAALAGDPADAEHMRRAREFILDAGGLERTRVFTQIWLALFGLWSWDDLPVMPPELMLLPPSGSRSTSTTSPAGRGRRSCRSPSSPRSARSARCRFDARRAADGRRRRSRSSRCASWPGAFQRLDQLLHVYERRPSSALRRARAEKAERWIVDRQEADGSWGGIQPPWVYSLIALHLLGLSASTTR